MIKRKNMKIGFVMVMLFIALIMLLPDGWGTRLLETEKQKQERLEQEKNISKESQWDNGYIEQEGY